MLKSLHDMFTQNTAFQELHMTSLVDFITNQILGSSSFIPMNRDRHDNPHAKMSALCINDPPTTKDATTRYDATYHNPSVKTPNQQKRSPFPLMVKYSSQHLKQVT
jgi:hypothetical protein